MLSLFRKYISLAGKHLFSQFAQTEEIIKENKENKVTLASQLCLCSASWVTVTTLNYFRQLQQSGVYIYIYIELT